MKLVGEAMKEQSYKENLTLIGIAKWGKVALRNKLIVDFLCYFTFYCAIGFESKIFFREKKRQ
jgi:hypothetical protein